MKTRHQTSPIVCSTKPWSYPKFSVSQQKFASAMAEVDALEIVVGAQDAAMVSEIMWAHGVSAVAEEETANGKVLLRSDLPALGLAALKEALAGYVYEVAVVRVDDGLDQWRHYARVSRAGDRLVLWPPWVELGEVMPNEIVIRLEPGRAWGDGAHPTTLACLAELERVLDSGSVFITGNGTETEPLSNTTTTVLDLGCGSGALSMAAALLGASRVFAVDIDPAALEATQANASALELTHKIVVSNTTDTVEPVDVVVANIGTQTLIDLAPTVLALLRPGGTVIMSGVLHPAPTELLTAYAPLTLANELVIDQWSCLTLS